MKLILLQTDIKWMDVQANLEGLDILVDTLPDADLLVLPEMFATGFCMEPEQVAELEEGEILKWMKMAAHRQNIALTGSVSVREGMHFYNRMYFVEPNGITSFYDKRHLFSYGQEDCYYTPGNRRMVVTYRGVRFLLQVCYDLRFPVWSRNRKDYDVALYVANWPVSRIGVWKTLLEARAFENQCFVVGVNRVGSDPQCMYNGQTTAYDFYGRNLGSLTEDCAGWLEIELDLEALEKARRKFPVLQDGDIFKLDS